MFAMSVDRESIILDSTYVDDAMIYNAIMVLSSDSLSGSHINQSDRVVL